MFTSRAADIRNVGSGLGTQATRSIVRPGEQCRIIELDPHVPVHRRSRSADANEARFSNAYRDQAVQLPGA